MLKYWLLLGAPGAIKDKGQHKSMWEQVENETELEMLPSMDDLDRRAIMEWPASSSTSAACTAAIDAPNGGAAHEDFTWKDEVCEQMMMNGVIPVTTEEQRRRHRLTLHTTYGVPSAFTIPFNAGYLHPDLQPPEGWKWRYRSPNEYVLLAKGG
jgi:uncharacterized protein involved in tolerance to divalent cations